MAELPNLNPLPVTGSVSDDDHEVSSTGAGPRGHGGHGGHGGYGRSP